MNPDLYAPIYSLNAFSSFLLHALQDEPEQIKIGTNNLSLFPVQIIIRSEESLGKETERNVDELMADL